MVNRIKTGRHILGLATLAGLFLFLACGKEPEPEIVLTHVTLEEWPMTDCSTSTSPTRDLVAYQLLGIPYRWEVSYFSLSEYMLIPDLEKMESTFSYADFKSKNLCSGTHDAYMNLLEGKADVIIVSRDISRNEKASSEEMGVELETAPLAIDAMVFIVNPKNPVRNLTADQVRKIYTGEITNWKEVGGVDHEIHPYTRNTDSGSQEKMETLVMAGLTMKIWPELIGSVMMSPYYSIESDEWGIAYTPYYYCTAMVRDLLQVNMLSINGVAPNKESLRKNKYPFVSNIYAAVRKTQDPESMAYKLYKFLFTRKGADMIDESGYIVRR